MLPWTTLIGCAPGSLEVATQEASFEVVDAFVEAQMQAAHLPGLGAAVVIGDDVVWTGAFGYANVEEERPVTIDTPFNLASVSKPSIAIAVMQQVEAGVLDLDADIDPWLPFPVDMPADPEAPVTLRHLLTHTTGIREHGSIWADLYSEGDSPISLGTFLEGVLVPGGEWYEDRNFLDSAPGETYWYSNIGASLAAYVVERATGVDYAAGCRDTIYEPLGMTNTAFHLADFASDEVAVPYSPAGEAFSYYGYPDYPDGLLRSSAADLAVLMTVFTGTQGGGILSPESVQDLLTQQWPDVVHGQGLILYRERSDVGRLWGHSGSDLGASTDFFFDRSSGVGVLLLMNSEWYDESAVLAIENYLFSIASELG